MVRRLMWILSLLCAHWIDLTFQSCASKQFTPASGSSYPGPYLYTYNKVYLSVPQCERMCRQILECNGFNLRWADGIGQRGTCEFFKLDVQVEMVDSEQATVFIKACPDGYTRHHYHCYQYVDGYMTWVQASQRCQNLPQGAYIVEVRNGDENNFVQQLADHGPASGDNSIWLGAKRLSKNDPLYWVTSGSAVIFSNWVSGQPNDPGEVCVRMKEDGTWTDRACDSVSFVYGVVCELEP